MRGFEGLTSVADFVTIQTTSLTNLRGLGNLTSIGGYLWLQSNHALTTLDGLEGLFSVGDYVRVYNNMALTTLDGFKSVTILGGHLEIWGNHELTNVDGISNVTVLGNFIKICSNPRVDSIPPHFSAQAAEKRSAGGLAFNRNCVKPASNDCSC